MNVNKTVILSSPLTGSRCQRFISCSCPSFHSGMNQFGQMGMQSMGQRSTPPLPINAPMNQVGIAVTAGRCFPKFDTKQLPSEPKSTRKTKEQKTQKNQLLAVLIFVFICISIVSLTDGYGSSENGPAQCHTVAEPIPPTRPVPWVQSWTWFWSCWHEPARATEHSATGEDP